MGRTFIQQDTQIYSSETYTDTLTAGSTLQSGAANLQDDLNSVRSQLKRVIHAASAGNWYDAIPFPVGSSARGLEQLGVDLFDIERKRTLQRTEILTDVVVPSAQNWVTLSVGDGEAPSEVAAVGASTIEGAVVAFNSGTFDTFSLDLVTGPNALRPKNLVIVRDAATGQTIQTNNGRDVYGLLQSEIATDGHTFDDATQRVQISFVREDSAGNVLEAVPVGDIQGKTINYAYVRRFYFDNIPEEAFLGGVFVDQSASVDVTLDRAIDNQSGPVTQTQNIDWRISDTYALKFEDSTGARNILQIAPNVAGDLVSFSTDDFTVTNTNTGTFTNGVAFDTSGTQINVGATAGQIDSAGALTLLSGGSSDLIARSAGDLYLDDSHQTGSTWAQTAGIKLSSSTAEWDQFETAFGEVSLLSAIYQARTAARRKGVAVPTGDISANTNVTFVGGGANLDAALPSFLDADFMLKVDVYLNGTLLRNGADSAANNDVYPGTTPANGDLKFEFGIRGGAKPDVITVFAY